MTADRPRCRYCDYTARWQGLCLGCFERTGAGDRYRSERAQAELTKAEADAQRQEDEAREMIVTLRDAGQEWWEISERLNALRLRHAGRPWSSDMVRNVYLALTADDWDD